MLGLQALRGAVPLRGLPVRRREQEARPVAAAERDQALASLREENQRLKHENSVLTVRFERILVLAQSPLGFAAPGGSELGRVEM